jgi:hypothetical protein
MTAIVGIQTVDGFALGADGLTVDGLGWVLCKQTQKIFLACKPPEYSLAYGWTGATNLKLPDGWFSFIDTGREVIEWLKNYTISRDNDVFFHAFSGQIFQRFAARLRDFYIPPQSYPRKDEMIACAFFVGYLHGMPIARNVMFLQRDYYLRTPEISNIEADFRFGRPCVFSGLRVSLENPYLSPEPDMPSGVSCIAAALRECIDKSTDESPFDGRIHIAQITQDTTRWADGFAPMGD